jgi:hypothetical protein
MRGIFLFYDIFIYKINNMKKIVRLTESDLIRLVKRIINEGDVYGSFGNPKRRFRGDEYIDIETDKYANDEDIFNIGSDDDFDMEEFDDYESLDAKYPNRKSLTNKKMFDIYREKSGRPLKLKTRRNRDI